MSDSGCPVVRTQVRDAIGVITLNRPQRLNAVTHEVIIRLREAFRDLGGRDGVRAIVLRGEGRAFCAGLDLEAGIGDPAVADPALAMEQGMRTGADLIRTMRAVPQPVIAVVQGHAVGAGFALAAASDVRFVGPAAVFSAPFLRLGMSVGDLGLSWFLPRLIGQGRASELFLSAGELTAGDAVEYGLAIRICEDPLDAATEYARDLAAFPVYGVRASKALMDASGSAGLHEHLDSEARAQVVGGLSLPAREAMAALLAETKKD